MELLYIRTEILPIAAMLRDGEQSLYTPIGCGLHLESKVLSNFELEPQAAAAESEWRSL